MILTTLVSQLVIKSDHIIDEDSFTEYAMLVFQKQLNGNFAHLFSHDFLLGECFFNMFSTLYAMRDIKVGVKLFQESEFSHTIECALKVCAQSIKISLSQ